MPSKTRPKKTEYHHGDLRRALMSAAVAFLAENDNSKLSMHALAREAGVSSGAPYHHFKNKEAVLLALAEEGFRILADELEAIATPTVRALGTTYSAFANAHSVHFELMFLQQWSDRSRYADLHAQGDRALAVVRRVVADTRRSGDQRELARALTVFAAIHGFSVLSNAQVLSSLLGKRGEKKFSADFLAILTDAVG